MEVSFVTSPGSADKANEDFVAATGTAAVVLDGLTQRAGLGSGCIHDTPWFVRQLGTRLLSAADTMPSASLRDILAQAISDVARLHAATCDLANTGTPSATVAMLREHPDTIEYLILSDSVLVVDGKDGLHVISDERVEDVAQDQRDAAMQHPTGSPDHNRLMRQLVAEQRRHRNQPGGYWIAGSNPQAASQALTGSWPRHAIRRAAILTDGATRLVDHFALADWPELLDILETQGPASVISQVRQAEALDPDGTRWPRYKRSDDATAVLCRPTPA
jgi:hypothetical protein